MTVVAFVSNGNADPIPAPTQKYWEHLSVHSTYIYKDVQKVDPKISQKDLLATLKNVGTKVIKHWNNHGRVGYEYQKEQHRFSHTAVSSVPIVGSFVAEYFMDPASETILRGDRRSLSQLFASSMLELERNGTLTALKELPFERQKSLLVDGNPAIKRLMRGNEIIRKMIDDFLEQSLDRELDAFERMSKDEKRALTKSNKNNETRLTKSAAMRKGVSDLKSALGTAGGENPTSNDETETSPSDNSKDLSNWIRVNEVTENLSAVSAAFIAFGQSTGMDREQLKMLQDFKDATDLVNGIAKVVLAPTTENVIKLIPAFGKVFGGRKPNQDRIAAMLRFQQEALKRLERIEKKIDRYHIEQMAKLLDVEASVIVAGGVIDIVSIGDAVHCHRILQSRQFAVMDRHRDFIDKSAFQKHCMLGLGALFNASGETHPGLWLTPARLNAGRFSSTSTGGTSNEFYLGEEGGINGFLRDYHAPLWNQVVSKLSSDFHLQFFRNYEVLNDLNWIDDIPSNKDLVSSKTEGKNVAQLRNLLDPVQTKSFAALARKAYSASSPYRHFGKRGGTIDIGEDTVFANEYDKDIGHGIIAAAHSTVSVALAQQNYYSGGPLLPLLVELLNPPWQQDPDNWLDTQSLTTSLFAADTLDYLKDQHSLTKSNNRETQKRARANIKSFKHNTSSAIVNALARNPVLRANVGKYYVYSNAKRVYSAGYSVPYQFAYSAACESGVFGGLTNLIGNDLTFEYINVDLRELEPEADNIPCLAFRLRYEGLDQQVLVELPTPSELYSLKVSNTAYHDILLDELGALTRELSFVEAVYEAINDDLVALGPALATYGIHFH